MNITKSRNLYFRFLLIGILPLAALACRFTTPPTETEPVPPTIEVTISPPTNDTVKLGVNEADLLYVDEGSPSQSLDIYYPASINAMPLPVMIYVHGGAWAIGDKSNVYFKDDIFTKSGYIFISINYRLSPEGTWEEMAEDVAAAVNWIYQNIGSRGGDPERIFLMGHSAGAHLVSLVAIDERYLQGVGLGLDALSGVVSLDTHAYNIPVLKQADGTLPKIYAKIFGNDLQGWESASPIAHISTEKNIPPMALAWSKGLAGNNASAREASARGFSEALNAVGTPTLLVDGSSKTHAEINRQFGENGDALTEEVMVWLSQLE
ncbi:MAG: alpha/beta hydrolase [Anaerolineae bacterium]|jgi:acetyl esterase/lipase|nr:alpha/beta hydrolase [Anaerolineae bacterium]MBT3713041.1 alpha/beta hydrolase [Anaerolineae bacterium]MBT4311799.1 alpha/beta hydrolase [Anaerolineae bacterium]MBT4456695.1 alpha/beta hydrolase [Anaerolineae bacterium]MBT4843291.1 alpha/beta hydrolase [Anaerolineae bacterium]